MERRRPLISHVDPEIGVKIKQAADDAGVTTSSYIASLLEDHVSERPTAFFRDNISVVSAGEVKVGHIIVIDPIFGMEEVLAVSMREMAGFGEIVHLQVMRRGIINGVMSSRFVFRGQYEPCVVVSV